MIGQNAFWLRPLPILYRVGPGRAGAVPGFESRVGPHRSAPARSAGPRWPRVSPGSRAVPGGSVLFRGEWGREGWRAEAWRKSKAGGQGRARVGRASVPHPREGRRCGMGRGPEAPRGSGWGFSAIRRAAQPLHAGDPRFSRALSFGEGWGLSARSGRPVPAALRGLRGSRAPGMPDTQLFPRPSRAGSGLVSSYTPYIAGTGPGRAGARWPPALQPGRARRGEPRPRSRPCPPSGEGPGSWGSGGFYQVKGGRRLVLAHLSGGLAG